MLKPIAALSFLLVVSSLSTVAQESKHATIISESSVPCGTKQQGKKKSTSLLCQQYTIRTATTEYQIRQEKPGEKAILEANTPIEFTINKDKMKLRANGKKYEFLVVGTSAVPTQTR